MSNEQLKLEALISSIMLNMDSSLKFLDEIPNSELIELFLCSEDIIFLFLNSNGFQLEYERDSVICVKDDINLYEVKYPLEHLSFFNAWDDYALANFILCESREYNFAVAKPLIMDLFKNMKLSNENIICLLKKSKNKQYTQLLHELEISLLKKQFIVPSTVDFELKNGFLGFYDISDQAYLLKAPTLLEFIYELFVMKRNIEDFTLNEYLSDDDTHEREEYETLKSERQEMINFLSELLELCRKLVLLETKAFDALINNEKFELEAFKAVFFISSLISGNYNYYAKNQDLVHYQQIIVESIVEYAYNDIQLAVINYGLPNNTIFTRNEEMNERLTLIEELLIKCEQIAQFDNELQSEINHIRKCEQLVSLAKSIENLELVFATVDVEFSEELTLYVTEVQEQIQNCCAYDETTMTIIISLEECDMIENEELQDMVISIFPLACESEEQFEKEVANFSIKLDAIAEEYDCYEEKAASFLLDDILYISDSAFISNSGLLCNLFMNKFIEYELAKKLDNSVKRFYLFARREFLVLEEIDYSIELITELEVQFEAINIEFLINVLGEAANSKAESIKALLFDDKLLKERTLFPNIVAFLQDNNLLVQELQEKKQSLLKAIENSLLEEYTKYNAMINGKVLLLGPDKTQIEVADLSGLQQFLHEFGYYEIIVRMQRNNDLPAKQCANEELNMTIYEEFIKTIRENNILFNYKELSIIFKSRLDKGTDSFYELSCTHDNLTWKTPQQINEFSNQAAFLLSSSLMSNQLFFEVISECQEEISSFYEIVNANFMQLENIEEDEFDEITTIKELISSNKDFLDIGNELIDVKLIQEEELNEEMLIEPKKGFERRMMKQQENLETFKKIEHSIVTVKNYINNVVFNVENKIICSVIDVSECFQAEVEEELLKIVAALQKLIQDCQSLLLMLLLLLSSNYSKPLFNIIVSYDREVQWQPEIATIDELQQLFKCVLENSAESKHYSEKEQAFYDWLDVLLDLRARGEELTAKAITLLEHFYSPYARVFIWINGILNLSLILDIFVQNLQNQHKITTTHITREEVKELQIFSFSSINTLSRSLLEEIVTIFVNSAEYKQNISNNCLYFEEKIGEMSQINCNIEGIFEPSKESKYYSDDYIEISELEILYEKIEDDSLLHGFLRQFDSFLLDMKEYQHEVNNINLGIAIVNASNLLRYYQTAMYSTLQKVTYPIIYFIESTLKQSFEEFLKQHYETADIITACTTEQNQTLTNTDRVSKLLKTNYILRSCKYVLSMIADKSLELSNYLHRKNILIHAEIEELLNEIKQQMVVADQEIENIDEILINCRLVYLQYCEDTKNEYKEEELELESDLENVRINEEIIKAYLREGKLFIPVLSEKIRELQIAEEELRDKKIKYYDVYEEDYLLQLPKFSSNESEYLLESSMIEYIEEQYLSSSLYTTGNNIGIKIEIFLIIEEALQEYEETFSLTYMEICLSFEKYFNIFKKYESQLYEINEKGNSHIYQNDIVNALEVVAFILEELLQLKQYECLEREEWAIILDGTTCPVAELVFEFKELISSVKSKNYSITGKDIIIYDIENSTMIKQQLEIATLSSKIRFSFSRLDALEAELLSVQSLDELISYFALFPVLLEEEYFSDDTKQISDVIYNNIVEKIFVSLNQHCLDNINSLPLHLKEYCIEINNFLIIYEHNIKFCEDQNYYYEALAYIRIFIGVIMYIQLLLNNELIIHAVCICFYYRNQLIFEEAYNALKIMASISQLINKENLITNDEIDVEYFKYFSMETKNSIILTLIVTKSLELRIINNIILAFEQVYNFKELGDLKEYENCFADIEKFFSLLNYREMQKLFMRSTGPMFKLSALNLLEEDNINMLSEYFLNQSYQIDHINKCLTKNSISSLLREEPEEENIIDLSPYLDYFERFEFSEIHAFMHEIVVERKEIIGIECVTQVKPVIDKGQLQILPLYRPIKTTEIVAFPKQMKQQVNVHPVILLFLMFELELEESVDIYTSECVKIIRSMFKITTHFDSSFSPNLDHESSFPLNLFLYYEYEKYECTFYSCEIIELAFKIVCDSILCLPHDILENNEYRLLQTIEAESYLLEAFAELRLEIQEFLQGFLCEEEDTQKIIRKIFVIPFVYEKVEILDKNVNVYEAKIKQHILAYQQYSNNAFESAAMFPIVQECYIYYCESQKIETLSNKYLIDSIGDLPMDLLEEQLLVFDSEGIRPESTIHLLNNYHYEECDPLTVFSEQLNVLFINSCKQAHFNKQFEDQIQESLNYTVLFSEQRIVECYFEQSIDIFNWQIEYDDYQISLPQKEMVFQSKDQINIEFLSHISEILIKQLSFDEEESEKQYSYSNNQSTSLLSKNRNSFQINEVFGEPFFKRINDDSEIFEASDEQLLESEYQFVSKQDGWASLLKELSSNDEYHIDNEKLEELQNIEATEALILHIFLSSFLFEDDTNEIEKFFYSEFEQMNFCRDILQYIVQQSKRHNAIENDLLSKIIYEAIEEEKLTSLCPIPENDSEEREFCTTKIDNMIRDKFLQYGRETFEINIIEISELVYEALHKILMVAISHPKIIELYFEQQMFSEIIMNTLATVLNQQYAVDIIQVNCLSKHEYMLYECLKNSIIILTKAIDNDLFLFLRDLEYSNVLVIIASEREEQLPTINIIPKQQSIQSECIEAVTSYKLQHLVDDAAHISDEKFIDKSMIFRSRLEYYNFSLDKIHIQEKLLQKLLKIKYFDKYYIVSVCNTLCDYIIEIICQFSDEVMRNSIISENQVESIFDYILNQTVTILFTMVILFVNNLDNKISKIESRFWYAITIFVVYHQFLEIDIPFIIKAELKQEDLRLLPQLLEFTTKEEEYNMNALTEWQEYITYNMGTNLMLKLESDIPINKFIPIIVLQDQQYTTELLDKDYDEFWVSQQFIIYSLELLSFGCISLTKENSHEYLIELLKHPEIHELGLFAGLGSILQSEFIKHATVLESEQEIFSVRYSNDLSVRVPEHFISCDFNVLYNLHSREINIDDSQPFNDTDANNYMFNYDSQENYSFIINEKLSYHLGEYGYNYQLNLKEYQQLLIDCLEFYKSDKIYAFLEEQSNKLNVVLTSLNDFDSKCYFLIIFILFSVEEYYGDKLQNIILSSKSYLLSIAGNSYVNEKLIQGVLQSIRQGQFQLAPSVDYLNKEYNEFMIPLNYSSNNSMILEIADNAQEPFADSEKEDFQQIIFTNEIDAQLLNKLVFFLTVNQNLNIYQSDPTTIQYCQQAIKVKNGKLVILAAEQLHRLFLNICRFILDRRQHVYVVVDEGDIDSQSLLDLLVYNYPASFYEDRRRDLIYDVLEVFDEQRQKKHMSIPALLQATVIGGLSVLQYTHYIVVSRLPIHCQGVVAIKAAFTSQLGSLGGDIQNLDGYQQLRQYHYILAKRQEEIQMCYQQYYHQGLEITEELRISLSQYQAMQVLDSESEQDLNLHAQNSKEYAKKQKLLAVLTESVEEEKSAINLIAQELQGQQEELTFYLSIREKVQTELKQLKFVLSHLSKKEAFYCNNLSNNLILALELIFPNKQFKLKHSENLETFSKQIQYQYGKTPWPSKEKIASILNLKAQTYDMFFDNSKEEFSASTYSHKNSTIDYTICELLDMLNQNDEIEAKIIDEQKENAAIEEKYEQENSNLEELIAEQGKEQEIICELKTYLDKVELQNSEVCEQKMKIKKRTDYIEYCIDVAQDLSSGSLIKYRHSERLLELVEHSSLLYSSYVARQSCRDGPVLQYLEKTQGKYEIKFACGFSEFVKQTLTQQQIIDYYTQSKQFRQLKTHLLLSKSDVFISEDKIAEITLREDDQLFTANASFFEQLFQLFDCSIYNLEEAIFEDIVELLDESLLLLISRAEMDHLSIVLDCADPLAAQFVFSRLSGDQRFFVCQDIDATEKEISGLRELIVVDNTVEYQKIKELAHQEVCNGRIRLNYQLDANLEYHYDEIPCNSRVCMIYLDKIENVSDPHIRKYKIRRESVQITLQTKQYHCVDENTITLMDRLIEHYEAFKSAYDLLISALEVQLEQEKLDGLIEDYTVKRNMTLFSVLKYKQHIARYTE